MQKSLWRGEIVQSISTQQYYKPSIEYPYKCPISGYQIESARESIHLSNEDLMREYEETSVSFKPQKDIELLEGIYTFKNPPEIRIFLWTHIEGLIETLFSTYNQIKRVFGENMIGLYLEYDRDHEEKFEGLFAVIETNLSPEESLNLLDKFDEEWFLDNVSNEVGSIFNVMVRPL